MIYSTRFQSARFSKPSVDDLLSGNMESKLITLNESNTITQKYDSGYYQKANYKTKQIYNEAKLYSRTFLHNFIEQYKELFDKPSHELFRSFCIPKRSGGLRRIDAPNDILMEALRSLKVIIERSLEATYHTSAFAYMKGRGIYQTLERHQQNESKWFGKYDVSNFFGSIDIEFLIKQFKMIHPYSYFLQDEYYEKDFRKAISLAFLDGKLPQGTPISPLLTNIIMIPIDFELNNTLRDFEKQKFVYTRYADDFHISSKFDFDFRKVERLIEKVFREFEVPFELNKEKTHYGSSAGRNWILGLMLNGENQITVGHKRKKELKNMLFAFGKDLKNNVIWPLEDVQHMEGIRSYCKMVEGETIDKITAHIGNKLNINLDKAIKEALSV